MSKLASPLTAVLLGFYRVHFPDNLRVKSSWKVKQFQLLAYIKVDSLIEWYQMVMLYQMHSIGVMNSLHSHLMH